MVIAQCNDCTLQSLPLLLFSLPRRVNHHTLRIPAPATLHARTHQRSAPRRNAAKTSRPHHCATFPSEPAPARINTRGASPTQSFLSYPAPTPPPPAARRCRIVHGSSHPLQPFSLTPHPHLPSSLRACHFLTPPVGQTQRAHPPAPPHTRSPHHQPQRQQTNKPTSREAGKLVSAPPVPCRLPPAGNGDSTMHSLHSAITAQCGHTTRRSPLPLIPGARL